MSSFLDCASLDTSKATFSAVDAKGNSISGLSMANVAGMMIREGEITASALATALAALGAVKVDVTVKVKARAKGGEKPQNAGGAKGIRVKAEDAAAKLAESFEGVEIDRAALAAHLDPTNDHGPVSTLAEAQAQDRRKAEKAKAKAGANGTA